MYNGIGLRTARGTATNGYVQRNYGALDSRRLNQKRQRRLETLTEKNRSSLKRKGNREILEHYKQREIEVKLMELRVVMEEKGIDNDEIERKVKDMRQKAKAFDARESGNKHRSRRRRKLKNSHEMREERKRRDEDLRRAFKISTDRRLGEAFSPEFARKRMAEKEERRLRKIKILESEGKEIPSFLINRETDKIGHVAANDVRLERRQKKRSRNSYERETSGYDSYSSKEEH